MTVQIAKARPIDAAIMRAFTIHLATIMDLAMLIEDIEGT